VEGVIDMKNKCKFLGIIIMVMIIGLLAGCGNPAGGDTTYSIDYYSISQATFDYLMSPPSITSKDSHTYILSQDSTEWLEGEAGRTIDEITDLLLDLNFTEDEVDPWMQNLRNYGIQSIWYSATNDSYAFFYFEEE
jgi:hypothetical protein